VLDGHWKIDSSLPGAVPIPSGTRAVDIDLREFAFVYDESAVTSGNFGFSYENIGAQTHEIAVVKLVGDTTLEQALMSEEEEPAGIEFIGVVAPIEPGQSGTLVFTQPLGPGNYALVCFFPDTSSEEGIPHAFLGMTSEFTVGGGITPPSTGDAGLTGQRSGSLVLPAVLSLLAVVAAGSGLALARRPA
jgi:hypothetical protein